MVPEITGAAIGSEDYKLGGYLVVSERNLRNSLCKPVTRQVPIKPFLFLLRKLG